MLTQCCNNHVCKSYSNSVSYCNPFSPSLYQQTPLHIAAGEGYKITSKLLVDGGAKLNMENKSGVSIILILPI